MHKVSNKFKCFYCRFAEIASGVVFSLMEEDGGQSQYYIKGENQATNLYTGEVVKMNQDVNIIAYPNAGFKLDY